MLFRSRVIRPLFFTSKVDHWRLIKGKDLHVLNSLGAEPGKEIDSQTRAFQAGVPPGRPLLAPPQVLRAFTTWLGGLTLTRLVPLAVGAQLPSAATRGRPSSAPPRGGGTAGKGSAASSGPARAKRRRRRAAASRRSLPGQANPPRGLSPPRAGCQRQKKKKKK